MTPRDERLREFENEIANRQTVSIQDLRLSRRSRGFDCRRPRRRAGGSQQKGAKLVQDGEPLFPANHSTRPARPASCDVRCDITPGCCTAGLVGEGGFGGAEVMLPLGSSASAAWFNA